MSIQDVSDFFRNNSNKRFAVAAHQRPDGDAIGSAVGLVSLLRRQGLTADAVNLSPVPGRLSFITQSVGIMQGRDDWFRDYDCLAVVDCGEWDRLDETSQKARDCLAVVNIDHHASSKGVGEAVWIDPVASSVGEMIVTLARHCGWDMPADAAQSLWVAIITDTGRFSYDNTSVASLAAAEYCLMHGANPSEAAERIYQSVTRQERLFQTRALTRMEFFEQGRLGLSWLQRQDFADAACGHEGAQDMVNLIRDTEGVTVAVFLTETALPQPDRPGLVKASIRTALPHDALLLASAFGGGGHHRAAGCTLHGSIEDAKQRIVEKAHALYF